MPFLLILILTSGKIPPRWTGFCQSRSHMDYTDYMVVINWDCHVLAPVQGFSLLGIGKTTSDVLLRKLDITDNSKFHLNSQTMFIPYWYKVILKPPNSKILVFFASEFKCNEYARIGWTWTHPLKLWIQMELKTVEWIPRTRMLAAGCFLFTCYLGHQHGGIT